MAAVIQLLKDLSEEVRSAAGDRGVVQTSGDGLDFELHVRPRNKGGCAFIVHAESENEVSIEFGAFSVAHIASSDMHAVRETCQDIIDHLIAGKVKEIVWVKRGSPCRAVAYVGMGSDVTSFSTRRGLCLTSERHEYRYEAYK